MHDYHASTYGDRIADVYDSWYQQRLDPSAAVEFLAELAGDGRALELGVGTGRVALPLAGRGVKVEGIDASEAMVAKLRAKPGGADIPVTFGDFADVAVDGTYRLVYVPFTTLFALPSQAEQIRCLRNVAAHLDEEGAFVMDAFVPDVTRYRDHQAVTAQWVAPDALLLDVSRHDPVNQTVESSHVLLSDDGVRLYPVCIRYAWPAELDAMALAAGLGLASRFGGYDRRPFDATSTRHVSVYRKFAPPSSPGPPQEHPSARPELGAQFAPPSSPGPPQEHPSARPELGAQQ
jgi:SAM-dependent methyltransferase